MRTGLTRNLSTLSVGVSNISPSAIVEISSTVSGLLIPRMTSTQRLEINSPDIGLIVFDTTNLFLYYWDGGNWTHLSPGSFTMTFTNDDLVSGILYVNHNLNAFPVVVQIYDQTGLTFNCQQVQLIDTNNLTVILSSFVPITGTWSLIVRE